jgi:uncharacterized delta-60 repeat protein
LAQAPLLAWLSSGTQLAAARPYAGTVASAHHAKDATLRVVVRSLPGRLSAKIIVTGPHHVHKRVSRSVALKLPAGAYSLSAAPVKSSSGSYYATTPRSRVVLRVGKATSSTVVYATLVPKSTVVVPAGATVTLTGDPSGPRVLTITGSAVRAVRVGDSLSSGVTSAAPYGYLVKVTKVAHKSGSSATLDVENTTLLAALPTGEINSTTTLEGPASAASLRSFAFTDVSPTGGLTIRSSRARSPRAHTAGFSLQTTNLTCTTSAGVHIEDPTVTFAPSISLQARWGFLKVESATFTATLTEQIALGVDAEAGAKCETNDPGIGLLPQPITLPDVDVQVGPVPVIISPTLQLYLSGSAGITAKASASLTQTASATVGASYNHGTITPISSVSNNFTPAFSADGDASAEVALTPTVDTKIYDVAGPSFDVGVAAKFDANTSKNPWWTLQGCLQGGVGFVVELLDIDWSDPHLLSLCKTLLSANGGHPGGGGSTGGGSGGGGSGGGGGPGGGSGGGPGEHNPGSDSSGLLDTGFGIGGQVQFAFPQAANDTSASSVAVQPDGDIVAAGTAAVPAGSTQVYVSRFTSAGQLDASFGAGGTAIVNESHENCFANGARGCPTTVVADPDGKIYVAYCLAGALSVARLDQSGSLDSSFANGLPVGLGCNFFYPPPRVQLDGLGRLVLLGTSPSGYVLVRLKPDGSLDEGFGEGGEAQVPFAHVQELRRLFVGGLAIQSDGTIAVGGSVRLEPENPDEPETQCAYTVARVTESGHPDDTFGNGGRVLGPMITGLCGGGGFAGRPDGGYIDTVEAGSTSGTGGPLSYIYALTPTGELNVGFGSRAGWQPLGLGATLDVPETVIVTSDNRVLVGGIAEDALTVGLAIERLTPEGLPDLSFGSQGISEEGCKSSSDHTTSSLAVGPDGSLVAGATESDASGVNACVARWSGGAE